MKILHLIDHVGLGGAQNVVYDIISNQRKNNNIKMCLISLSNNKIASKFLEIDFDYFAQNKYSLRYFFTLRKIIEKEKFDVLHCHLQKSLLFGFLMKSFFFPELKLIFHEQGKIFTNSRIYSIFIKLSKKQVNKYIAVSKATKNHLIEKGKLDEKQVTILYNCIDTSTFKPKQTTTSKIKDRIKLTLDKTDFVVGFAGRFVRRKGWLEYIKAAEILIKERNYQCFKFLIVGDGKEKKMLIKVIKDLELESYVESLGHQNSNSMVSFYSLLNCLVVPSHWEPMGLTHIEAQAMGIPVIASDVPAINEIIHDKIDGLFFQVRNSNDLANKIILLHENRKLQKNLIINGLENSKRFSLSNYQKRLEDIYFSL